jgi:hypothetical protein
MNRAVYKRKAADKGKRDHGVPERKATARR